MRGSLDRVHVLRILESKTQQNPRNGAILNLGTRIARVLTAIDGRKWRVPWILSRGANEPRTSTDRLHVRGYRHPDFRSLRDTIRSFVPLRGNGGVAIAVYHRGALVADLACGTRDRRGNPFQPETLALSMSTGKGVMATLLHVMVDRGLIDLEAPVAK